MKSMTSDRHQSNVWPNGKKKEGTTSNGEEKGGWDPTVLWPKTFHSASPKGLQHCMIVYHGAGKSTPYYGNDPEKTWYRISSLRRDRKGLHETTSLHQETNGGWTSNTKQKSWQSREDAHGPEQYTVPLSSGNLGSLPTPILILTALSLYAQSTREEAGHTHLTPREGSQLKDYFIGVYIPCLHSKDIDMSIQSQVGNELGKIKSRPEL